MKLRTLAALALAMAAAGCTTTEDASKALKSRWIGQPSDVFFSQYGAPISAFPLNSGGQLYRWRGGDTQRVIPAQYRTVTPAGAQPGIVQQKTTTTVSQPDANTTVTRTTTTGLTIGQPQQVLVSPERVEALYCEAQISVDAGGIITNIEPTQDTTGAGLSLSRCAEVFGVTR